MKAVHEEKNKNIEEVWALNQAPVDIYRAAIQATIDLCLDEHTSKMQIAARLSQFLAIEKLIDTIKR